MRKQRKPSFQVYLQSVPADRFFELACDCARSDFSRLASRCGSEILEEFNNDVITKLELEWEEME